MLNNFIVSSICQVKNARADRPRFSLKCTKPSVTSLCICIYINRLTWGNRTWRVVEIFRWVMSFVLLSMNYHSRFVQGLFRPIHKIRLSTRGKSGKRCICVYSLRDGIFQNQWTPKLVRVHLSAARRQWLVLWCSYLTARWGLKAAFCQPFSSETARTSRLEHYFHLPRINSLSSQLTLNLPRAW